MRIRLVSFNARYTHSCLALFYVRNELERYLPGVEIEIVQMTINDPFHESLLMLGQGNPDYIFFSSAIWNSERIESLIHDLNLCLSETQYVVGGPQAEMVSRGLKDVTCTYISGPIEEVDEAFYTDMLNRSLQRTYSRRERTLLKRGYTYPYREEDFGSHLKNRHIYYESSRGCPFSCTYCLSAKEKAAFHKPLSEVKKELLHILSFGPPIVRFIDRTFNDKPQRALEIWQFLAEQETETLFHFEIAPDRFTEEMYSFLEKLPVGRFQFEIGIQSTNRDTLKAIQRYIEPIKTHETVNRLATAGNIHLHVDLILGLPHETAKSFYQSLADVFAMGPHYIQMGLLKILPDTPICQDADELGYVHSRKTPYSVLATKWMGYTTVTELYWLGECVEKFHNNRYFLSLWSYLRRYGEDVAAFFRRLLLECEDYGFFHRAATHEVMLEVLFKTLAGRQDCSLLQEMLTYDWLRCGHRFFPECVKLTNPQDPLGLRKKLYKSMPGEVDGLYERSERNSFFKKGFFISFSNEALQELGFGKQHGSRCLRFSQQREESLFSLIEVRLL